MNFGCNAAAGSRPMNFGRVANGGSGPIRLKADSRQRVSSYVGCAPDSYIRARLAGDALAYRYAESVIVNFHFNDIRRDRGTVRHKSQHFNIYRDLPF